MSPAPWNDLSALHHLGADLRAEWVGRQIFRVSVGPDWLRLDWKGDDPTGLLLSLHPGAILACAVQGNWPTPVRKALPLVKGHLLNEHLPGTTLLAFGLFPADKIWALRFKSPDDRTLTLLHQVFGPRGNTTLLDEKTRLIWARNHPPHPLIHREPPAETWTTGEADAAELTLHGDMHQHFLQRVADTVQQQQRARLVRLAAASERLTQNLRGDLDHADRGDEFRRTADALAANLHTLTQGQEQAEIYDLLDGSPLTVPLDPALAPAANLEVWYRKARKAAKGCQIIAANLEKAERRHAALQAALMALDALGTQNNPEACNNPDACLNPDACNNPEIDNNPIENLAAIQEWEVIHQDLLPAEKPSRRRAHSPEEPARPFRRYLLDDRWEVWVGRNNKENDELTHRASHTKDIWLHAQGVPGSHVILRTSGRPDQVPKMVIEKAAALAALHCRSKHSALVPVIYTERRYVRKPRKASPGLAVCLREKNLFAEPGVPEGVVPI